MSRNVRDANASIHDARAHGGFDKMKMSELIIIVLAVASSQFSVLSVPQVDFQRCLRRRASPTPHPAPIH